MNHNTSCFQNSPLVRKAYSASGASRQSLQGLGYLTKYAQNLSEGQICAFLIGDSIDRRLPFDALSAAYDAETARLCQEIKQLELADVRDLSLYETFSPKAREIVMATLMLVLDDFVLGADAPPEQKRNCLEKVRNAAEALMPMQSPRMCAAFYQLLEKARAQTNIIAPAQKAAMPLTERPQPPA